MGKTLKFEFDADKRAYITVKKALGKMRIIYQRPLPDGADIKSISITKDGEQWFACILVETHLDIKPNYGRAVGIDMGVAETVTMSNGEHINQDKAELKRLRERKAHLQKQLSRKIGSKKFEKKSGKWMKLKKRILKIDSKIKNENCLKPLE